MRVFGHDRSHMRLEAKLSWKKLAFPVLVFLVFPGVVAYAFSISALLSGIADFTKSNIQDKMLNSQNFFLLASAAGVEPLPKDDSADVNVVAGSALLADAGPSGGMADVSDSGYDHGHISIYVVREGDSFSSIASMFDVSVNTILWANNLARGAKLQVGQTLVILPVSGVQYVVKKDDTVTSIAKKYGGDRDEILSFNGLDDGAVLSVGSLIIIPDGEIASAPVTTSSGTARLRNAGGPLYEGYYRAPFTSYRKTQGLHGYNGVDLAAMRIVNVKSERWPGAPVMAAAGGSVIVARQGGYNGGYGSYVVIQHGNGTQTLYGHLKSITVSSGTVVFQGQVIGYEGSTGRSTGTHLHFEIRGARNPF